MNFMDLKVGDLVLIETAKILNNFSEKFGVAALQIIWKCFCTCKYYNDEFF